MHYGGTQQGHDERSETMTSTTKPFLTFENPPADAQLVISNDQIAEMLKARPGEAAVVNRPDRRDRAQKAAERIREGKTFGPGFAATVRAAGDRSDVRVYAWYIGN
jgi:hypothetical protein